MRPKAPSADSLHTRCSHALPVLTLIERSSPAQALHRRAACSTCQIRWLPLFETCLVLPLLEAMLDDCSMPGWRGQAMDENEWKYE